MYAIESGPTVGAVRSSRVPVACADDTSLGDPVIRPVLVHPVAESSDVITRTFPARAQSGMASKLSFKVSGQIRAICDAVGQTESCGVSFASDGGVLRRDLGYDCVLFGPGSMAVAHKPDEWIHADELRRARPLLDGLVRTFCEGTP